MNRIRTRLAALEVRASQRQQELNDPRITIAEWVKRRRCYLETGDSSLLSEKARERLALAAATVAMFEAE